MALAYIAAPDDALMCHIHKRSIEVLGAGHTGMMLYLQTDFVALLAYLFLGECLRGYDLASAAFIVAGLGLAAIKMKPPRAEAAAVE